MLFRSSRPSSTQVDYVPVSASQTLIATASALGSLASTPVLVNNYQSSKGGHSDSPTGVNISTSTPIATRKGSSPPVPASNPRIRDDPLNRNTQSSSGIVSTRHTRSVSDSANNNNKQDSPTVPKKSRVVPPIFEGDSGEWQLRKRQVSFIRFFTKMINVYPNLMPPGQRQYRGRPRTSGRNSNVLGRQPVQDFGTSAAGEPQQYQPSLAEEDGTCGVFYGAYCWGGEVNIFFFSFG